MHLPAKALIRSVLPRRYKPHRILFGPNRGFRMVTSWHDYPAALLGYCEVSLLRWMDQNIHPGETWLDIGGHYGNTALRMCDCVGFEGRVFSFEPNPVSAGCLTQTRRLNNLLQLRILPFGLTCGHKPAVRKLPSIRGMVDSTVRAVNSRFFEDVLFMPFMEIWPQIHDGNERIHGIKIDVQGMEIEVLRGLGPMLASQRPILIVEIHQGVKRHDLLGLISNAGYHGTIVPIEPVAGEKEAKLLDNRIYLFSTG